MLFSDIMKENEKDDIRQWFKGDDDTDNFYYEGSGALQSYDEVLNKLLAPYANGCKISEIGEAITLKQYEDQAVMAFEDAIVIKMSWCVNAYGQLWRIHLSLHGLNEKVRKKGRHYYTKHQKATLDSLDWHQRSRPNIR